MGGDGRRKWAEGMSGGDERRTSPVRVVKPVTRSSSSNDARRQRVFAPMAGWAMGTQWIGTPLDAGTNANSLR